MLWFTVSVCVLDACIMEILEILIHLAYVVKVF